MTQRLKGFIVLLVLSLLAVPQTSQAPLGHIPVIGLLLPTSAEVAAPALQAFRQSLDTLGYREGRSVVFESRFAAGAYERLPALAAELVRLRVDVLLAGSPAMIRAATQATTAIPIVGIGVRTGLFARFTRPGANLTGVGTGGRTCIAGDRRCCKPSSQASPASPSSGMPTTPTPGRPGSRWPLA